MNKLPVFLLSILIGSAQAQPAPGNQAGHPPGNQAGRHGPPAEVLNACKGKKEGDSAQVKTPRGDTVTGRCRLVLVPEMPAK